MRTDRPVVKASSSHAMRGRQVNQVTPSAPLRLPLPVFPAAGWVSLSRSSSCEDHFTNEDKNNCPAALERRTTTRSKEARKEGRTVSGEFRFDCSFLFSLEEFLVGGVKCFPSLPLLDCFLPPSSVRPSLPSSLASRNSPLVWWADLPSCSCISSYITPEQNRTQSAAQWVRGGTTRMRPPTRRPRHQGRGVRL